MRPYLAHLAAGCLWTVPCRSCCQQPTPYLNSMDRSHPLQAGVCSRSQCRRRSPAVTKAVSQKRNHKHRQIACGLADRSVSAAVDLPAGLLTAHVLHSRHPTRGRCRAELPPGKRQNRRLVVHQLTLPSGLLLADSRSHLRGLAGVASRQRHVPSAAAL